FPHEAVPQRPSVAGTAEAEGMPIPDGRHLPAACPARSAATSRPKYPDRCWGGGRRPRPSHRRRRPSALPPAPDVPVPEPPRPRPGAFACRRLPRASLSPPAPWRALSQPRGGFPAIKPAPILYAYTVTTTRSPYAGFVPDAPLVLLTAHVASAFALLHHPHPGGFPQPGRGLPWRHPGSARTAR